MRRNGSGRKETIYERRHGRDVADSVHLPGLMGPGLREFVVSSDYIKLTLWRPEKQTARWISAPRPTADYYGWTKEFEIWTPKIIETKGGYSFHQMPGRRSVERSGRGQSLRISRSQSRSGYPAGFTNQFQVSRSCRLIDLAELAHFTQGDWHWMETFSGERLSREHWEKIYQSGSRRIGRGLVLN